jgi:hypothetical protein
VSLSGSRRWSSTAPPFDKSRMTPPPDDQAPPMRQRLVFPSSDLQTYDAVRAMRSALTAGHEVVISASRYSDVQEIEVLCTQRFGNILPIEMEPADRRTLNDYAIEAHDANQKWWHDLKTGERLNRNKGEMLALIHSEISEALEGERRNLMDDHLPHRRMAEVELADALIRIFDYAAGFGYDLEGAYRDKMAYNAQRADHSIEGRTAIGGKKF